MIKGFIKDSKVPKFSRYLSPIRHNQHIMMSELSIRLLSRYRGATEQPPNPANYRAKSLDKRCIQW
jgi:hypothetical protein